MLAFPLTKYVHVSLRSPPGSPAVLIFPSLTGGAEGPGLVLSHRKWDFSQTALMDKCFITPFWIRGTIGWSLQSSSTDKSPRYRHQTLFISPYWIQYFCFNCLKKTLSFTRGRQRCSSWIKLSQQQWTDLSTDFNMGRNKFLQFSSEKHVSAVRLLQYLRIANAYLRSPLNRVLQANLCYVWEVLSSSLVPIWVAINKYVYLYKYTHTYIQRSWVYD